MAVAYAFERTELPLPPASLGTYAVRGHLAEGGMASIFRGQDTVTGELVALKTVREATSREITGLQREIETLRRLKHPGVVRLVADGQWDNMPWMALELLEGHTLFHEIASLWRGQAGGGSARTRTTSASVVGTNATPGAADVDDAAGDWMHRLQAEPALRGPRRQAAGGHLMTAVSLVVRLARALDYVHSRGVVHRDLKPENIFVGNNRHVTLLDFGLSCGTRGRALEGEGKRTRLATVEYAAPELLCGDRVDARADIYALGCILYELLTGVRPFDGDSARDIAHMQVDQDPVCPSERVTGLSWRMEDVVLDMLAKKPRHRPRTAADVAGRLTEAYYEGVAANARS